MRTATDSRPASRSAVATKQRNKGRQSGSCRSPERGNTLTSRRAFAGRRVLLELGEGFICARGAAAADRASGRGRRKRNTRSGGTKSWGHCSGGPCVASSCEGQRRAQSAERRAGSRELKTFRTRWIPAFAGMTIVRVVVWPSFPRKRESVVLLIDLRSRLQLNISAETPRWPRSAPRSAACDSCAAPARAPECPGRR